MMTSPGFYAGRSVTLSFFGSATGSGTPGSLTLPASIQAGDLIIMCNASRNNIGGAASATPTGFTTIINQDTLNNTRIGVWYKIAAGTEGGTSPGGFNGGVENERWAMVFRGDVPIGSVNISSLNVEQTDNAPANQTVAVGQSSLVTIAGYRSSAAVSTRGFSPGSPIELTPANTRLYGKYLIVNGVPVSETISMADDGNCNTLFSFNAECLPA